MALSSIEDISDYEERIEETRKRIISQIELYFPILSETSKRYSAIACFSESVESVLMWSHYANSHKGFALDYNFRPTLEQPIKNVGLFPVVYSKERFDISDYIAWAFLRLLGSQLRCRIYQRRLRMRYGSLIYGHMRRSGE